jgi:hypothetical protein
LVVVGSLAALAVLVWRCYRDELVERANALAEIFRKEE